MASFSSAAPSESGASRPAPPRAVSSPSEKAAERCLRVFLVEDSVSLRERLGDFLSEPGKIEMIGFAATESDAVRQLSDAAGRRRDRRFEPQGRHRPRRHRVRSARSTRRRRRRSSCSPTTRFPSSKPPASSAARTISSTSPRNSARSRCCCSRSGAATTEPIAPAARDVVLAGSPRPCDAAICARSSGACRFFPRACISFIALAHRRVGQKLLFIHGLAWRCTAWHASC